MSNTLYCCSLPDSITTDNGEPAQVLLRLYGDHWKESDMSVQIEIFSLLSSKELGPMLYGNFEDGRLEEFLPATSLTSAELMDHEISSIIARKLAKVHSLDVPRSKTDTWILDRMHEFLASVREISYEYAPATQELNESTRQIAQKLLAVDFESEIKYIQDILGRIRTPKVFSHNDLHQGNILLAKHSKRRPTLKERLVFIDFEYCSYNYRAYDLANHFCEWCFEYDTPEYPHFMFFENRFPSEKIQHNFVRNYAQEKRRLVAMQASQTHNGCHRVPMNHPAPLAPPAVSNGLNGANAAASGCDMANEHCRKGNAIKDTSQNGQGACEINARRRDAADKCNGATENGRSAIESCKVRSNGCRDLPTESSEQHSRDDDLDAEESALIQEMKPLFMAANLLWSIWCVKSALTSSIKFGYWEHAMARWTLYSSFKTAYSMQSACPKVSNGHDVCKIMTRPGVQADKLNCTRSR